MFLKTPVTPEEIFQAIGRLRKEARDEIERLLRFLDETDNHMERQPEGDDADDEPSLTLAVIPSVHTVFCPAMVRYGVSSRISTRP